MLRFIQSFLRELGDYKKFLAPENQKNRGLVFYSEHTAYGKFFNPVLDALLARNPAPFSYLASDAQDPVFGRDPARLRAFYIQNMLGGLLPQLDAKALVMTLPDLGQYHLKRSQQGTEHVYLFHALVSTHMIYRKGAFDHYDTLLCGGPHHVEEIRRSEKIYGLKSKKLVEAGYPLLDKICADFQKYRVSKPARAGGAPLVLIAPSWAPGNILLSCLEPLVRGLDRAGMRVIIRPHPEFLKRFPKAVPGFRARKDFMGKVEYEITPRAENSLFEADALITDWSGIALEYAFGTGRPVLFVDTPRKVFNPEYEKLGIEPLEVRVRAEIGQSVRPQDAESADARVRELIQNGSAYREAILAAQKECLFNAGRSAGLIADYLQRFSG